MFGNLSGWHIVVIGVVLFAVVFIGIAALVIVLIAKNGRRSTQSQELGSYHAEWTFPRGGTPEAPADAATPRQDPAGPPSA